MTSRFIIVNVICLYLQYEVSALCSKIDWSQSFKSKGLSICDDYIRGFYISDPQANDDIGRLEAAQCCGAYYPWYLSNKQTVHADWGNSFNFKGLVSCPEGFFLRGLMRIGGNPGYLYDIEEGRCTKPDDHPRYYKDCYQHDITECIKEKGLCQCRDKYFVAGMERDDCHLLTCLRKLKCCRMWDKPVELDSIDKVKERIMDVTLLGMATLGHVLGYGWAGGCREPYVGEGYNRVGDTWEADKNSKCEGYKSDHRLKMVYGNWKFEIKETIYGKAVTDELEPETIDSGIVRNNDSATAKKTFVVEETITKEVTHTTLDNWKDSNFLRGLVAYYYDGPRGPMTYSFSYATSSTIESSMHTKETSQFILQSEKNVDPYSALKWNIVIAKKRTTVPYTATILVKFTVEFQGFLRWGGDYYYRDTNYHREYRGSENRPGFHYQFGNSSVPFYKALEEQSRKNDEPWMWYDMKLEYPYLESLIYYLSKESLYEFTLRGKFEDVSGKSIHIEYEKMSKKKREADWNNSSEYQIFNRTNIAKYNSTDHQVIKGTHIAKSGVLDLPAKVVPPDVFLDNHTLLEFDNPLLFNVTI